MTTTTYPRIPELAPRQPAEPAEAYGLRALHFVTATDVTVTLPAEALELANHVYPLAVSGPELNPSAAVRLARVQDLICGELRRRAGRQPADAVAPVQAGAAEDRPAMGPMAPLSPPPAGPAPSTSLPAPTPVRPAQPVQAASWPLTRPQAALAASVAARPAPAARPVAPAIPAAEWGF